MFVSKLKKKYIEWDLSEYLERKENFFRVSKHPNRIVLSSAPLSGKTVLLKSMCKAWADGSCWKQTKCVVYVDLCKCDAKAVKSHEMLANLAFSSDLESVQSFISWYEENTTIWVLDHWKQGVHEMPSMENVILATNADAKEFDQPSTGIMEKLFFWKTSEAVVWTQRRMDRLMSFQADTFMRRYFGYWSMSEREEAAKTVRLCLHRKGGVWRSLSSMIGTAVLNVTLSAPPEASRVQRLLLKEKILGTVHLWPFFLRIICSSKSETLCGLLKEIVEAGSDEKDRTVLRLCAFNSLQRQTLTTKANVPLCALIHCGAFVDSAIQTYLAAEYLCYAYKDEDVGRKLLDLFRAPNYNLEQLGYLARLCFAMGGGSSMLLDCMDDWILEVAKRVGSSVLFVWMADDQTGKLEAFLREKWKCVDQTKLNRTLHVCAEMQVLVGVKLAVEKGANCSDSKYPDPALVVAAENGFMDILKYLVLEGQADLTMVNKNRMTALMVACMTNRLEVCQFLIENGAPINQNVGGWNALKLACDGGHLRVAELLVKHGANVELEDFSGATPLICAASSRRLEVVQFLLKSGADVHKTQKMSGMNALMFACKHGAVACVKVLLEHKSDPNACSSHFSTLAYACQRSSLQLQLVKLLLEFGADVNLVDPSGMTAFLHVCSGGGLETAKYLVANGADYTFRSQRGRTALMLACSAENEEMVRYILSLGSADLNAVDDNGWNVTQIASPNILQLLQQHK